MQKINLEKIKKSAVALIFLTILGASLILYTFNTDTLYKTLIIFSSIFAIFIFSIAYKFPEELYKRRKEIILLFGTILILLILIETILIVTSCERHYEYFPEEIVKVKHEPYKTQCNHIKDGSYFFAISNGKGYLDDEFTYEESDYNIFLIGDSFAQCLQADYENCVHRKLQRDLQEEYNNQNIDVMNFGIGGVGGLAELGVIKQNIDTYKPKLIIMYFLAQNDIIDNADYNNYSLKPSIKKTIRKLTPRTLLFFVINSRNLMNNLLLKSDKYRLKQSYGNQNIKAYEVYSREYTEEWEKLVNIQLDAIAKVKEITDERNITFLLIALTSTEQVYEEDWQRILKTYPSLDRKDYKLDKPNKIVVDFAKENNILHLDLLPLFKQNQERLHWEYDGHWNNAGQIFASEKIKEYIDKNKLIK